MMVRFINPDRLRRLAHVAIAGLAALSADHAGAAGGRRERAVEVMSRPAGEPIIAVVSLRHQRIVVYDADGWILRAPVSSGQKGRETPAGIFSVIQKNAEHYSNLYDDAFMPHMQRITWSGIALHGGVLPGYPASHGCVRMPFDFAERLFDVTRLGLRVIVAPGDAAPIDIVHPALLSPKPDARALAAARAAAAEQATEKADQARLAAVTAAREVARATVPVRVAENLMSRAQAHLAAAEAALASATSVDSRERAESLKAQALARIDGLKAQWDAANAALQPKVDAVAPAREAAVAAEAARVAAAEAAREAAREFEPLSLFVSRKTQRLYVRRAFRPVLESPVTILDADLPIGTHVFTAMERTSDDTGLRWSVVALDDGSRHGGAKAALDRIVIPPDVLDRIAATVSPRSSLIVSDEGPSTETGNGTDFVVVLSGEPQGSLVIRRRRPATQARYGSPRGPYWRSPYPGRYWAW